MYYYLDSVRKAPKIWQTSFIHSFNRIAAIVSHYTMDLYPSHSGSLIFSLQCTPLYVSAQVVALAKLLRTNEKYHPPNAQ